MLAFAWAAAAPALAGSDAGSKAAAAPASAKPAHKAAAPKAPPQKAVARKQRPPMPPRDPRALKVERLSLAHFVRRAIEKAPDMEVARWEIEARRAVLQEAKAQRYIPEAEVINQTGIERRARGTVLDPKDSVTASSYGPFTKVDIFVTQPLFTGGKITAGIEAATHAVEAQRAASKGVEHMVVEQVKTLYYNALLGRSIAGVLGETESGFSSALDTARQRRDQGDVDISELDILYLRVGHAEVAKEIPAARSGELLALRALRRMAGYDMDAPVDIADRFLEPAKERLEPLANYQARLYSGNPRWKELKSGLAAKSEEMNMILADFYPGFFLSGGFRYAYAPERTRQLNPFAWDDYNYLRGPGGLLGIRWSINFHVTAAKAEKARVEVQKLQAQARQAETGLALELEEAYQRVLDTRTAVRESGDGRKAGRAILTLSVTNFDVGIGDASEILNGLGNYARVSGSYYESVRDYDVALAALSRVTGEEVTSLRDELR